MQTYNTTNSNLAKLLEMFGHEDISIPNERPQTSLTPQEEYKYQYNIPEDSALYNLLKEEKVVNFLQQEEDKFKKLREPSHSQQTEEPAMDCSKPAFADLARLSSRDTAFSGVQHWEKVRNVKLGGVIKQFPGLLIRPFFSQFFNMNASKPDEYRTIAVTSNFNNNDRFGKSGLTFDQKSLLLSYPQDFGSVRFKVKLDPRTAYQNYTTNNFGIPALAFDPSDAAKQQMSEMSYRDSVDPNQEVQKARERFAEQTKFYSERFPRFLCYFLDINERSKLNKAIAEQKKFLRESGEEGEYNEMHFPAGILLAKGFFCTNSLNPPSLDLYKKLAVFREFLSAEGDATPQQKELLREMFEGATEAKQEMLRHPEQMREKYLEDYAMYFKGIFSSHQKRVEKLMEEDKIEAALTLAMQADYFSQFTTIQAVRNQLKQPLDFTIFHSETKDQEKIDPEELSSLLLFNLGNIIDSDLVKPEDKQDFQIILYHLDMRKINEFFQRTDSSINPTFPPEILGTDGKLDLSKFLQAEDTQDLLKPYFENLDKKSHFIKEEQKLSSLRTSKYLATSMGYAVVTIVAAAAIAAPAIAPVATGVAICSGLAALSFGVAAIGHYALTKTYYSAKLQQIENLRKEGKEITLPTACKQIIDQKVEKLYKTITKNYARTLKPRESQPNTAISGAEILPQVLGIEQQDVISL